MLGRAPHRRPSNSKLSLEFHEDDAPFGVVDRLSLASWQGTRSEINDTANLACEGST